MLDHRTTAHQGHGIRIAVQLPESEYTRSRGNPFPGPPLFSPASSVSGGLQIFSPVLPFATSNNRRRLRRIHVSPPPGWATERPFTGPLPLPSFVLDHRP